MFGWSRPTCPVDPREQQWIEERLAWLAEQFGLDVFTRQAVLVPQEGFFPRRFPGTDEAIRALFEPVCRRMGVKPETVQLELFATDGRWTLVDDRGSLVSPTAAQFEPGVVRLNRNECHDVALVIGTIAHELARHRLIGDGRATGDEHDIHLLADLTVVFHGLGVCLANSPRSYANQFAVWPGTETPRPVYMTQPMIGYALAMQAWMRHEQAPSWGRKLNMDARHSFRRGLRYLWSKDTSTASAPFGA